MISKTKETTRNAKVALSFKRRICVPQVDDLIWKLLMASHGSRYSIHLVVTWIYRDLKQIYWWQDMKNDIEEFVSKCQNCQQLYYEHQRTTCFLQKNANS